MDFTISPEEKQALLGDARETITAELEKRQPAYETGPALQKAIEEGTSVLTKPCGAFVSLHSTVNGEKALRGCIGRMIAPDPLEMTVRSMAFEAAFRDPRFPPLGAEELSQIHIEISVLAPMELCKNPGSIQIGVHGLYLKYQGRAGVFLPQVPVEQGWKLDEYLDYLCRKAGLPMDSWGAPGAELYTFTAEIFGEEESE